MNDVCVHACIRDVSVHTCIRDVCVHTSIRERYMLFIHMHNQFSYRYNTMQRGLIVLYYVDTIRDWLYLYLHIQLRYVHICIHTQVDIAGGNFTYRYDTYIHVFTHRYDTYIHVFTHRSTSREATSHTQISLRSHAWTRTQKSPLNGRLTCFPD